MAGTRQQPRTHATGPAAADRPGGPPDVVRGAILGLLTASRIGGAPQTLRRTPAAGQRSTGRLKLCIQLAGIATISQSGHDVTVGPGQMGLYDTALPYRLRLEQRWSCVLLAFPRHALSLPHSVVQQAMTRAHCADAGPGAVLADFVTAAMSHQASIGGSAGRVGEAGLHLIAGALRASGPGGDQTAADVQRLAVLQYVREHLADRELNHDRVAAVHRMAPRSLHRLFEHERQTVTEYVRVRRLEAAHRDLTDPLLGHLSIARIAARWCFASQAHFTRTFQTQYGVTPSAVRRR